MADTAFDNAKARLASAELERATLRGRLAELDQEVARATRFISEWEEWAGVKLGVPVAPAPAVKSLRPVNPSKEKVGNFIETLLKEIERPAARKRLMEELKGNGIVLNGTNPDMVLSTMLWRMKDRFIRLPGLGYWLRDRPYAPAGYKPEDAEKIEAAAKTTARILYPLPRSS